MSLDMNHLPGVNSSENKITRSIESDDSRTFSGDTRPRSVPTSDVKMSVFGRFVCLSSGEMGAGEPFTIGGRYVPIVTVVAQ
jgi:hypothetical protein